MKYMKFGSFVLESHLENDILMIGCLEASPVMSGGAFMSGGDGAFMNRDVDLLIGAGAFMSGGDLMPNLSRYITSPLNSYVLTYKN